MGIFCFQFDALMDTFNEHSDFQMIPSSMLQQLDKRRNHTTP